MNKSKSSTVTNNISGGEAIIRSAKANGIDTVFGIPGAQIYPMFDAMAEHEIDLYVPRHEQAAAYMAYGSAKSTGNPSAFSVVPGPGVLNTTAALVTAMGGCAPVLCLTGQVPSAYLGSGRGHLHELEDQPATLKTLIKDAVRIDQAENTQAVVNGAFHTMQSGRQGPVSIEMCWDTMARKWDVETGAGNSMVDKPEPDLDAIKAAAKAIASAKKPMIVCGAGAQSASTEVLALAELLHAPVSAFRSGRGVVSEDHPLGLSSLAARSIFDDVDVLIGIGSRLEMVYMRWRDMGQYEKKPSGGPTLIRIDIDPAEMDKLQPDYAVVADAADACSLLLSELELLVKPNQDRVEEIAQAKALAEQATQSIQPQVDFLKVIRDVLPRDGFFVPELSQMGFTSYFSWPVYQPRTYVTEGYQGTLGFGFPTALGVQVANPDKAVVSVCGDGGLMFGIQELATAATYNIPLITIVFNNNAYGNVRRDQEQMYKGRLVGADLKNPDFVRLAESFDVKGYRVNTPAELKPVLERAFADRVPALIEVVTATGSETSPWEYIMMPENPIRDGA